MKSENVIAFQTECGRFWVYKDKIGYHVMVERITHSVSESAFAPTEDGLSLAIYRAKYLAKRANK